MRKSKNAFNFVDHGVCHRHSTLFLQQEIQCRQYTHKVVFLKKLFINTDSEYLTSFLWNVKYSFILAFNHLKMGKHFNFMDFTRPGGRLGWFGHGLPISDIHNTTWGGTNSTS